MSLRRWLFARRDSLKKNEKKLEKLQLISPRHPLHFLFFNTRNENLIENNLISTSDERQATCKFFILKKIIKIDKCRTFMILIKKLNTYTIF